MIYYSNSQISKQTGSMIKRLDSMICYLSISCRMPILKVVSKNYGSEKLKQCTKSMVTIMSYFSKSKQLKCRHIEYLPSLLGAACHKTCHLRYQW